MRNNQDWNTANAGGKNAMVSGESLRIYRLAASCGKKEKAWDCKAQIKTQTKILADS